MALRLNLVVFFCENKFFCNIWEVEIWSLKGLSDLMCLILRYILRAKTNFRHPNLTPILSRTQSPYLSLSFSNLVLLLLFFLLLILLICYQPRIFRKSRSLPSASYLNLSPMFLLASRWVHPTVSILSLFSTQSGCILLHVRLLDDRGSTN